MMDWRMKPIGFIRSAFTETSQIPKGLGAEHRAEGVLEVLPEYSEGLLDIEGFSHLFIIWVFDRSESVELVGTPPSDNKPHGVFATRSPYRPNPIGLTTVKLIAREGSKLILHGIDMLDGTPVLDIKPFLSNVPAEMLKRGWLAEAEKRKGSAGGPAGT
jgi:tRNA-Thr(GGU) m(6)t(6)A37 methyltransferase TsaA